MAEGTQSPEAQRIQEEDLIGADFDPVAAAIAIGTWIAQNPEVLAKIGGGYS